MKLRTLVLACLLAVGCPSQGSGGHTATVKWSAGGQYWTTVRYRIYRSGDGSVFKVYQSGLLQTPTSWTDTNVLPNHRYWYYVTAYDSSTGKESSKSPTVSVVIP